MISSASREANFRGRRAVVGGREGRDEEEEEDDERAGIGSEGVAGGALRSPGGPKKG